MTAQRRVWYGLALAAASAGLIGSVLLAIDHAGAPRTGAGTARVATGLSGMMAGAGGGMMNNGAAAMGGEIWLAGDGRVTSIPAARQRAAAAGQPRGLRTGEVIWFDNGFYVELVDSAGASATEVIVDPATGRVSVEPGPATMWNTRYGIHRATATGTVQMSAAQATDRAGRWLADKWPGRHTIGAAEAYPGYYTLDFSDTTGGFEGMMSVNATTGQIWYHTWHGTFIAREDT